MDTMNMKLAVRSLLRTPVVSLVAVLSLALGIGANAAIFSMFETMLLRPLPVERPGDLVNLTHTGPISGSISTSNPGGSESIFSYPMLRDLEERQTSFDGIAGYRSFGANLAFDDQTMGTSVMLVSGSYFPVLRVQPEVGRLFTELDDEIPGAHPVVVLSHQLWRDRFGSDPAVEGREVVVNGHPMTVVGVTPEEFKGTTKGSSFSFYVPLSMRQQIDPGWDDFDNRMSYWIYSFARLKEGVTAEAAEAAINQPYRSIIQEIELPMQTSSSEKYLTGFEGKTLELEAGHRGQSFLNSQAKTPLLLLMSVTGMVLLIACANIANLLLNKATEREAEIALRMSLGARRAQVVRQLLLESVTIAMLGGLAGLAVAQMTLQYLRGLLPFGAGAAFDFEVGPAVWLFMLILSLLVSLIGLYPALHSTRTDLAHAMNAQSTKSSPSRAAARFRVVMATVQIAISTALLIAAGLFVQSLVKVSRVDLGLAVEHLAVFGVSPNLNGYTNEQSMAFFERIEEEVGALPGVRSVSASMVSLIAGNNWGSNVSVEGFETTPDTDTHANYNEVGPGFFSTMGMNLLAGREFTRADNNDAPGVAVINQRFADKFELGKGAEALGRRMQIGSGGEFDLEIVGVVDNAHYSEVRDQAPALFFIPYRQDMIGFNNFYVRAQGDPEQLLASIRETVQRLDPNLPINGLQSMDVTVRENLFLDRLLTSLAAAFALLATLLAAIGLYGVLAYSMTQRSQELGLRMALGADAARIRRLVFGELAWMAVPGALIGTLAALGIGRFASSLLYEMEGHDPFVFAGSLVLLVAVALASGLAPALRATRVDPMRVLRQD